MLLSPCTVILLVRLLTIFFACTANSIACDGCDLCYCHPPPIAEAMTSTLHVIVSIWSAPCHDAQNIKLTRLDHRAILSYLEAILRPSWGHFVAILGFKITKKGRVKLDLFGRGNDRVLHHHLFFLLFFAIHFRLCNPIKKRISIIFSVLGFSPLVTLSSCHLPRHRACHAMP